MAQIRQATREDVPRAHLVIERAYRSDSARLGWTHEADLVPGDRTDGATLAALVDDPDAALLIAFDGETLVGTIQVVNQGNGLAYFGLVAVEPTLQARGLGKRLIEAAEDYARDTFGAKRMELTVIHLRTDLIPWYERRGYSLTGEQRAFPITLDPPLYLSVLVKPLA